MVSSLTQRLGTLPPRSRVFTTDLESTFPRFRLADRRLSWVNFPTLSTPRKRTMMRLASMAVAPSTFRVLGRTRSKLNRVRQRIPRWFALGERGWLQATPQAEASRAARASLRKRGAAAATESGRPTALPSHPVPLWGSAAAESARAFKRQRTSDAAPGAAEDAVLLDAGQGPAELGRTPTANSYKETGKFIARLCISGDHKIQLGTFVSAAGAACA